MKVVNRKEFLKMENVLYAVFDIGGIEDIKVMRGNQGYENDFNYSSLFGDPDSSKYIDFFDQYKKLNGGENVSMEVDYIGRDGLYEDNEKYLIFEKEDLEKVIILLTEIKEDM